MNDINKLYELWLKEATLDADLVEELNGISGNEDEILDRFYRCLEFGTGGLRGVMGAGANRMNKYTVSKATKGLADYLNACFDGEKSVAIAFDSRNNSQYFAEVSAGVLCKAGIKVFLFDTLMPTPVLSFAVRYHNCTAGIVITASHNPKEYNGYKVYWSDGAQLPPRQASEIAKQMSEIDIFTGFNNIFIRHLFEFNRFTFIIPFCRY